VLAASCAAIAALSLWLFPLADPAVEVLLALGDGAGFAGAMTIANLPVVERRPKAEWNRRLGWLETALTVGQGGALVLAAWLSGLSARDGLLIGAIVPASAIPLALLLIPRMPPAAVRAGQPPPCFDRSRGRVGAGQPVAYSPPSPAANAADRATRAARRRFRLDARRLDSRLRGLGRRLLARCCPGMLSGLLRRPRRSLSQ